jgi:hypothetical protein
MYFAFVCGLQCGDDATAALAEFVGTYIVGTVKAAFGEVVGVIGEGTIYICVVWCCTFRRGSAGDKVFIIT